MSAYDGGPAFARTGSENHHITEMAPQKGMTLRDYFAAKAMQGICANDLLPDSTNAVIAKAAYDMADDMLKARQA